MYTDIAGTGGAPNTITDTAVTPYGDFNGLAADAGSLSDLSSFLTF